MKKIQPGDLVVGMAIGGEAIEVYKVVKVAPDGVQVEETSGKLSRSGLRVHDAGITEQIMTRQNQANALRQEIRELFESLEPVG